MINGSDVESDLPNGGEGEAAPGRPFDRPSSRVPEIQKAETMRPSALSHSGASPSRYEGIRVVLRECESGVSPSTGDGAYMIT
ncbi:hypothetical protein GT045_27185 [Streptomyces sp. SID486]|uniref:hypothetical protein n=1 Tax=unclassified Streptomyces TaxID=2593676 RepID=UPI00136F4C67|nr:hypothetical protein [Streptomyces sp. SID486]MYX94943.1 hypothetical protein [Streptomyces sp. SID486]MYX98387.1 hypothetical protein [Streptomyces sp. SID486]